MRKYLLLITAFIGFASLGQAQQKVYFSGEVRDTLGTALEFANVLAIDTTTNKMAAFGVTNPQGEFRIPLDKGVTYKIQISFIGFLPFEQIYTPEETNKIPYGIVLNADVNQLDDVEVVSEMPVLIQGDTITYKAEVFTQGNERKLEDVLEDLPGFEVDEEGGVRVQGKSVDKVLVDGKEFFEGDTKLATKNLPANVVDKVQVLQNFNDIGPLSGVNSSEQLALNIQLKEDKKNILFGDITAGAGPEDRYLAKANTFFYNAKTNINLIAGTNNIGDLTFTTRDFFRFNGGIRSLSQGVGSSFRVNSGSSGIPTAERNNAQDLNNQTAALNYNFTPNKAWTISGFAIGAKVDNTLGSISQRTYILQPNLDQETLTSQQRVESTLGLFKLGLKYTPNMSLQIDYNGFGRLSDIRNSDTQNSTFGNISNDISGLTTQEPVQVDQQLRAFYTPNDKDVYSVEASYQYQFQDPRYNLINTGQPFASIIPMTGSSPFNLNQVREIETERQETLVNYYRILNKTNHINFKVGNVYSSQSLTSNLFESLTDGSSNAFNNPSLVNLVDFTFQDYYAGVQFRSKIGDLEISPSLNLHYYDVENFQNDVAEGFEKTLLLPAFLARYQFRSSHSLTFNYNVSAEFRDVENYAEGLIVRGYNSLFGGNTDLRNSLYHTLNLNYVNFNMYNFLNVYGGMNYSRRLNDISSIVQFNNLERVNTPINIGAANEALTGYANIDKRFDNFRVSAGGNWTRSITNNIISDTPNQNVSFNQSYNATLSTTLFKSVYIDAGYRVTFNSYEGRGVSSQFENHQPNLGITVEFLKGFTFDTEYQYNSYVSPNNPNRTFEVWDAELRYRKDGSPWEFKVEGMNLLNTTGIRQDSFSQSLISTYEYFIQKRYYMASIMFDL